MRYLNATTFKPYCKKRVAASVTRSKATHAMANGNASKGQASLERQRPKGTNKNDRGGKNADRATPGGLQRQARAVQIANPPGPLRSQPPRRTTHQRAVPQHDDVDLSSNLAVVLEVHLLVILPRALDLGQGDVCLPNDVIAAQLVLVLHGHTKLGVGHLLEAEPLVEDRVLTTICGHSAANAILGDSSQKKSKKFEVVGCDARHGVVQRSILL